MKKVKVGHYYKYEPVGMDSWDPCTTLASGSMVRVVNMTGCPPANTMGHCYVVNKLGDFEGLVLCNSLVEISEREAIQ